MNLPAIAAGVLTLAAFAAHVSVGARETHLIAPDAETGKARTAWVQALAAFHWVAVDLFASGTAFLLVGLTDVIPHEPAVLLVLGVYYAACGAVWLIAVAAAGSGVARRYLVLGQWLLCLLVAALAFLAR